MNWFCSWGANYLLLIGYAVAIFVIFVGSFDGGAIRLFFAGSTGGAGAAAAGAGCWGVIAYAWALAAAEDAARR